MKAINIEWDVDPEDYLYGDILLPNEIDLPDDMTDIDDILDYISDVTGLCHRGFQLMGTLE